MYKVVNVKYFVNVPDNLSLQVLLCYVDFQRHFYRINCIHVFFSLSKVSHDLKVLTCNENKGTIILLFTNILTILWFSVI